MKAALVGAVSRHTAPRVGEQRWADGGRGGSKVAKLVPYGVWAGPALPLPSCLHFLRVFGLPEPPLAHPLPPKFSLPTQAYPSLTDGLLPGGVLFPGMMCSGEVRHGLAIEQQQ